MKKVLFFAFALALFTPAVAQAKISLYGQFDVLGYAFDGTNSGGSNSGFEAPSNTYMRAILGANFGLEENVEGNVALWYGKLWGEDSRIDGDKPGESAQSALDTIKIAEANVVFKNLFDNDMISLKVGRFFYGEEGNSIFYVGPKDLNSYLAAEYVAGPRAMSYVNETGMDGALLTYNDTGKNLKIDFGYSKLSSYDSSTSSNYFNPSGEKVNLVFADGKYKYSDMLNLQAYVYDAEMYDGSDRYRLEFAGVKPSIEIKALKASLEVTQSFYSNKGNIADDGYERYFVKADASYKLTDSLTPRAMYFRTGDNYFNPYNDIYTGLIVGSYMYYIGNLNSLDFLNVGVDYKINKFKILADYFRLVSTNVYHPYYEIDLRAEYYYKEKIVFKAGCGYYAMEQGGDANKTIYTLGLGWKF